MGWDLKAERMNMHDMKEHFLTGNPISHEPV